MSRIAALLCLTLGGCLSPGTSEESHTWELAEARTATAVRVKVLLPSHLRRPTLLTHDGNPVNHDLDRWADPLDAAIARQIASDLADLPINDLVVNVQRLEVTSQGEVTLIFAAEMQLKISPNAAAVPFRTLSERIGFTVDSSGPNSSRPQLASAAAGYAMVPGQISRRIRSTLARELGEVAKPAPAVTVPTR